MTFFMLYEWRNLFMFMVNVEVNQIVVILKVVKNRLHNQLLNGSEPGENKGSQGMFINYGVDSK